MPSIALIVAGAYFALFALALLWNVMTDLVAGIGAAMRARQFPHDVPLFDPRVVVTLVHGTWGVKRRGFFQAPLCAKRFSERLMPRSCFSGLCGQAATRSRPVGLPSVVWLRIFTP